MSKNFLEYLFSTKKSALDPMTPEEYRKAFLEKDQTLVKAAYEKAWAAKNLEIENYWKRATYSWAFQVASFAGYFAVFNSSFYPKNTEILYCVICIGFITALAWSLINKGSKTWQRNWENHVDMLEDSVTGPLYKTVTTEKTYSVSKINEIVSNFITAIWFVLGIKYYQDNITFDMSATSSINWTVVFSSAVVLYFFLAMIFGHGRGRFGEREFKFYSINRKTGSKST